MTNPNLTTAVVEKARELIQRCEYRYHDDAYVIMEKDHDDLLDALQSLDAAAPVVELYCDDPRDTPAARRAVLDAAERGGDAHQITDEDVRVANIRDTIDALGVLREKAHKAMRELETCELPSWLKKEEGPIEISEEMIDAAMIAYDECYRVNFEAIRGPMTAALKAGLAAMGSGK